MKRSFLIFIFLLCFGEIFSKEYNISDLIKDNTYKGAKINKLKANKSYLEKILAQYKEYEDGQGNFETKDYARDSIDSSSDNILDSNSQQLQSSVKAGFTKSTISRDSGNSGNSGNSEGSSDLKMVNFLKNLETFQDKLANSEQELKTSTEETAKLKQSLEIFNKQIAELQDKLVDLEEERSNLENQLEGYNELRDQHYELQYQLDKMNNESSELKAHLAELEKISNDPKGNSGKKKATTEKGNLEKIDKKLAKQEIDIKLRREAIERGIKQFTRKEQDVNFKKSIVEGEFKKLTRKEQDVNSRRGIVERKAKLLAKRENEIKQKERIIKKSRKHLNKLKDNYGKAQLLGIGDSKPSSVNSKLKTLDSLHKKSQKLIIEVV
ncbi:hypothetical protein A2G94_02900 [Francisella endosymbiont of Ornithodoros moubata]|uniref:hypothetical protein n=1 Tax=Francisella-like endosymbiont TaxID=512373 RepID=UPI000A24D469|nr:hypothetical protein A2G94_02900 [Francisella endosymbiont of Ornithodoros moubata]